MAHERCRGYRTSGVTVVTGRYGLDDDGVSDVAEIAWTGSEIIVVGVLLTILGLEVWQVWRWRR